MGKAWLNSQEPNTGSVNFKNRIINGDMQVSQRGKIFNIKNDEEFTSDRWVSSTANDNEIEVRCEDIYSPDEGSTTNTLDVFGDGSCVATYTLDGNANDLSGNYNGTWSGTEQYDKGKWGQGALFDGNSWIKATITGLQSSDKTISIFADKAINKPGGLVSFGDSDDDFQNIGIYYKTNGDIQFITRDNDNNFISCYTHNGNNGIAHIVLSLTKDSHIDCFVNGKKVYTWNGVTGDSSDTFIIGTMEKDDDGNPDYTHDNIIDQVRIFNRALTADEVRKLYVEDSQYIFKKHLRTNLITKSDTYSVVPYEYRFEGQHLADILANKEKATLSFEFASNVNKDYTVRLYYPDGTLLDSKTITYSGSGEFTKHSVIFDFSTIDLTKVNLDENLGLVLTIGENDEINEGDYLRITNVQFEKGSIATEFEVLPYEVQLDRCMRYYEYFEANIDSYAGNANNSYTILYAPKRITPSVIVEVLYKTDNINTVCFETSINNINKKHSGRYRVYSSSGDVIAHSKILLESELPGRGE